MSAEPPLKSGLVPQNVLIIGGSLTGLIHGVMLKRNGHNVHILEQNTTSERVGQAAGIGLQVDVLKFLQKYDLDDRPLGHGLEKTQILDKDMNMLQVVPMRMLMTSWDAMYYRMRANFDRYESSYCPDPPPKQPGDGEALYDVGKKVIGIDYDSSLQKVKVSYDDVLSGVSSHVDADLVIAADGGNSFVRQQLLPETCQNYSGYVGWRGIVNESELSQKTFDLFKDRMTCTALDSQSYVVIYHIPGEDGTLSPGKRVLNIVQYTNMDKDSPAFAEAMTDKDGVRHRTTLPIGKMADEVWDKHKQNSRKVMSDQYFEVLDKIQNPFITACHDTAPSRSLLCDGRVLLVGDALALFRPNVGASTNQGALDCLALEKVVLGQTDWEQWEQNVVSYARMKRLHSISWAAWFLSSRLTWSYYELSMRIANFRRKWKL